MESVRSQSRFAKQHSSAIIDLDFFLNGSDVRSRDVLGLVSTCRRLIDLSLLLYIHAGD